MSLTGNSQRHHGIIDENIKFASINLTFRMLSEAPMGGLINGWRWDGNNSKGKGNLFCMEKRSATVTFVTFTVGVYLLTAVDLLKASCESNPLIFLFILPTTTELLTTPLSYDMQLRVKTLSLSTRKRK